MTSTEPIIQVGILSSEKIEFILNGNFTMPNSDISSGKQQVVLLNEKILFNEKCYNEILLEPTSPTDSFDLMDVVIGIGFHWERKENQRFRGAIKLIVDSGQLIIINRINVED